MQVNVEIENLSSKIELLTKRVETLKNKYSE